MSHDSEMVCLKEIPILITDLKIDHLRLFDSTFIKKTGTQFSGNAKIPDDYSQCCKDHDSVQNELSKENEYLQAALSNAHLQLNEKVNIKELIN